MAGAAQRGDLSDTFKKTVDPFSLQQDLTRTAGANMAEQNARIAGNTDAQSASVALAGNQLAHLTENEKKKKEQERTHTRIVLSQAMQSAMDNAYQTLDKYAGQLRNKLGELKEREKALNDAYELFIKDPKQALQMKDGEYVHQDLFDRAGLDETTLSRLQNAKSPGEAKEIFEGKQVELETERSDTTAELKDVDALMLAVEKAKRNDATHFDDPVARKAAEKLGLDPDNLTEKDFNAIQVHYNNKLKESLMAAPTDNVPEIAIPSDDNSVSAKTDSLPEIDIPGMK